MEKDLEYIVVFNQGTKQASTLLSTDNILVSFSNWDDANDTGQFFVDDGNYESHQVYVKCTEDTSRLIEYVH